MHCLEDARLFPIPQQLGMGVWFMEFVTAVHTDVGIKKDTNQDSVLIQAADTEMGTVLLAAVCDGMGGLAKGEVASAAMVSALSEWFEQKFPAILYQGMDPEALCASWRELISQTNRSISAYGTRCHTALGTTITALLLVNGKYYTMNVGDSRVYLLTDNLYQITKDQTYVQRQMDLGLMTYEQSLVDPQRSVLLQCIGASPEVNPDFSTGDAAPGQRFLLCCDGFRHVIAPQEIYQALGPNAPGEETQMQQNLRALTELNKQRQELDNITAVAVRVVS